MESFYDACRAKKLKSMTYNMLITKGQEIAKVLITKDLVQESSLPSTDAAWQSHVQRFLQKRSLKSRKAYGESGDADTAAAEQFFANEWPGIFSSVDNDPSRVWNMADSSGELSRVVFWPEQTRSWRGAKRRRTESPSPRRHEWMGLGCRCMALGTRGYLVLLLQLTPLLLFSMAAGLLMRKEG